MVQHQARVGDTLDDYCPRDNEVTTHTVVETNDDGVSITRCQSCDAEHDYPGAERENGGRDDGQEGRGGGDGQDGPFRRPLIRASLPHPDGAPPPREPPVFTMHEQPPRGTGWRKGGRGGSSGNGGRTSDGNVQPKKHGRRRGGQGRHVNDQQASGNHSGNRANGNQAPPEERSGSKTRSSRRGRGRSR